MVFEGRRGFGHAVLYLTSILDSRIEAQGVQPLVRNAVTQNAPDIQVSGVFGLSERTYGACPV